jgi:hypothetical protein
MDFPLRDSAGEFTRVTAPVAVVTRRVAVVAVARELAGFLWAEMHA